MHMEIIIKHSYIFYNSYYMHALRMCA